MILKYSHFIQRSGMQQPAPSPNLNPYSLASRPWPSRRPYGRVATIRGMNADDRTSSYDGYHISSYGNEDHGCSKSMDFECSIRRIWADDFQWSFGQTRLHHDDGSLAADVGTPAGSHVLKSWTWNDMGYGHGLWVWYNTRMIRHCECTSILVIRHGLLHRA